MKPSLRRLLTIKCYCLSVATCLLAQESPLASLAPTPRLRQIELAGKSIPLVEPLYFEVGAKEEKLHITLYDENADAYLFYQNQVLLDSSIYPVTQITHLVGGEYVIHYQFIKNGVRSQKNNFRFRVHHALHEWWWFYPSLASCMALVIAAFAFFWYLDNLHQKIKLQNLRQRIADDLHDELSGDLSSLAIDIATIERRLGTLAPPLQMRLMEIKKTIGEAKENLSDTVWAIQPALDKGHDLFQKIEKFARKLFPSDGNVELVFHNLLPKGKVEKVGMLQRFHAYMIAKEALHNAYKHAQASRVEVRIEAYEEGLATIVILDDGRGFDVSTNYEGNGLGNYQKRAKESAIEVEVTSVLRQGTRVQLRLPDL